MKKLLWVSILLLASAQAVGEKISIRQWTNDLVQLETLVLEPLRETFKDQPCQASMGAYIRPLLEQLKTIRADVSSMSYLLFREIALSIAETLGPLNDRLGCDGVNKWALVENQLQTQVEYTSNVFSLMDVADTL